MPAIGERETFEQWAPGTLISGAGGSGYWDGSTSSALTVLDTEPRARIGPGTRAGRWQKTVAGTGFVQHSYVGGAAITARVMSLYFTLITAPSSSAAVIYVTSAGTNRCQWFLSTGRTFQLRNITAAVGVASSALVLGTRYRLEHYYNPAASQQRGWIYNPDESVFYDSTAVAAPATDSTQIRVGNTVSATLEYWVEDLRSGSGDINQIGPASPSVYGVELGV